MILFLQQYWGWWVFFSTPNRFVKQSSDTADGMYTDAYGGIATDDVYASPLDAFLRFIFSPPLEWLQLNFLGWEPVKLLVVHMSSHHICRSESNLLRKVIFINVHGMD